MDGYLGIVKIKHSHNHDFTSAAVLGKRDVGPETKQRLLQLFRLGYNPTQALFELKSDLKAEKGDNYDIAVADRSICPDVGYCYRLYYKDNQFVKLRKPKSGKCGTDHVLHVPSTEAASPEAMDVDFDSPSPLQDSSPPSVTQENISNLKEKVKRFAQRLCQNLDSNPDSYYDALTKFVERGNKIISHSSMINALSTFGTRQHFRSVNQVKKRRNALQSTTKNNVQPTAIARRKTAMGGRQTTIKGCPRISAKSLLRDLEN